MGDSPPAIEAGAQNRRWLTRVKSSAGSGPMLPACIGFLGQNPMFC
jgi:hypothetical protein